MSYFPEQLVEAVWQKARTVSGYDPNIWRQDLAGAWIRKDHYGVQSKYGWEIDHLKPSSLGGSDDLDNLNPLHWKNNLKKSNNYPKFQTAMSAENNTNIEKLLSWEVK